MGDKTGIEWTDATWNPTTGCTKVSAGCKHCYAERDWARLVHLPAYQGRAFTDVACHPDRIDQPLHWKRPRKVFVNSMSDLFHESVPDEFIADVFRTMAWAHQHTFQILTKRPDRMLKLLSDFEFEESVTDNAHECADWPWPLKNVWLGVSVEDQATADERIPLLLQTPAAVRWISAEPLLGPVDLRQWQHNYGCDCGWGGDEPLSYCNLCGWRGSDAYYGEKCHGCGEFLSDYNACPDCDGHDGDGLAFGPNSRPRLDWIVVGGESGLKARPMNPQWARDLRIQCEIFGVPFLFKQWGEWGPEIDVAYYADEKTQQHKWDDGRYSMRVGKKLTGRHLDDVRYDGYPEVQL